MGHEGGLSNRFLGAANGFSFADPPQTTSFVGSGRDSGIGMNIARAYHAAAAGVAESLQIDDPGPLTDFLLSKAFGIGGFSRASDFLPVGTRAPETLQNTERIRKQATDTYELGYKGMLGSDSWSVSTVTTPSRTGRFSPR